MSKRRKPANEVRAQSQPQVGTSAWVAACKRRMDLAQRLMGIVGKAGAATEGAQARARLAYLEAKREYETAKAATDPSSATCGADAPQRADCRTAGSQQRVGSRTPDKSRAPDADAARCGAGVGGDSKAQAEGQI